MEALQEIAPAPAQEVLSPENLLTPYNEFRTQLAALKEANAKTVFDYKTEKGRTAARAYCKKLGSAAVAIDIRRKEIGESARSLLAKINEVGNELETEVRDMIKPHKEAVEAEEQKEKQRIADIRARIVVIEDLRPSANDTAQQISEAITALIAIPVDATFAEFEDEATTKKVAMLSELRQAHDAAVKREAEQAELARLRAEKEDRDRKDREALIANEAAEKAKKEAEDAAALEKQRLADEKAAAERKAEEDRQAAAKREQDLRDAAAKAEQEAKDAIEKAERDKADALALAEKEKQEAIEAERARVEKARLDKEAEDASREADAQHQETIHNDIIKALAPYDISEEAARDIIIAIRMSVIPHISINY